MDYSYYVFALFVFVLLCGLLFLANRLFSDVKRQNRLLDEKEAKLLRLYTRLEDVMENFEDSVGAARQEAEQRQRELQVLYNDIRNQRQVRSAPPPASASPPAEPQTQPAVPQAEAAEPRRKPGKPGKPEPSFAQIISTAEEQPEQEQPPVTAKRTVTRTDSILSLAADGKNRMQIAKELGITLAEVDLVVGIDRR